MIIIMIVSSASSAADHNIYCVKPDDPSRSCTAAMPLSSIDQWVRYKYGQGRSKYGISDRKTK